MKKILITGSEGYIGSFLTSFLKKKNYNILGIDIGFFRNCYLYKDKKKQETIYKDVRNITESDLKNIDVIVHLAGISNDPLNTLSSKTVYDPTRKYTFELAQKAKKLGIKFIFASSCSVYGATNNKLLLNENSHTNPQTGYSLNKLQIEKDLEKIADKNFFPICLRFATIFGVSKRIRFDVVINMLVGMAITNKKIILNSNGMAWRPNLYIEDACSAIEHAIKYTRKKNDDKILILNIGRNDNNLKVIDIAKKIKNAVKGSEIIFLNKYKDLNNNLITDRKIKNGKDKRTYKVSFSKMKKIFTNYRCRYTIQQGIEKMIKKLTKHNLSKKIFYNKKFYRLQYFEYLHKKKIVDNSLKWII
jgi:nucleoside-diphosphate-sugar epimerase